MNYTQIKDERIDSKIEQELKIVCEEVLKVVKPISIILFGGFGRGEGSAQIINDEIILSKDYDILLVVKKKLSPSTIYQLSENIHRRLNQPNPLDDVTMRMGSGVSLVQYTLSDLLNFRDCKTYEIKAASKLLWGEDIRKRIPLKPEDLSPWNGIRFLLRKPPGLCAAFSPKYLKEPPTGEEKKTLIHECLRVYLDGGVLLTILMKNYKPTYRERAKAIKESLDDSLPELVKEIPDLPEKIEFLTNLKLFPSEEKYEAIDPVEFWFETRKDLGIILRYFMEVHKRQRAEGWIDLFEKYRQMMDKEFVDELAYFYLKNRFKISSKILARLANMAYQRLFCLKYALKLYRKERIFLPSSLLSFPTFRVSTSGLMLLFSLRGDGSVDENLFEAFVQSLSKIYPVKIRSKKDHEMWEEGVNYYIRADRTFLDAFYGWG